MSGEERIRRIREFIGGYPLYKKLRVAELFEGDEQSLRSTLPEHLLGMEPIFLWCPFCKAERPFRKPEHAEGPFPYRRDTWSGTGHHRDEEVYSVYLACTGCFVGEFRCWIEGTPDWRTVQVDGASSEKWLRKVGQMPPWDVSISRELEVALGADAGLYRSALVCMSQSYGVGACTYMRRVLENRVNPLLEVFYTLKEEEASAEELRGYREVIEGRVAEEKIRLANRIAPAPVAVPGENALELIYDKLSAGIHRLDEQACMRIAGEVRQPLEYVFVRIESEREQRESKRRYDRMVRALRDSSPAG